MPVIQGPWDPTQIFTLQRTARRRAPRAPRVKILGHSGLGKFRGAGGLAITGFIATDLTKRAAQMIEERQLGQIEAMLREEQIKATRRHIERMNAGTHPALQSAIAKKIAESEAAAEWHRTHQPAGAPGSWLEPRPGPGGGTRVAPAAPPPPPKKPEGWALWKKRALKIYHELLTNPLLQAGAVAVITSAASKASKRRPVPEAALPEEAFEPPLAGEGLTPFEDQSVFSGTVGGVPAFGMAPQEFEEGDELEEPEDGAGKCERITPPRSPGECRQGWFSESPSGLHLREWSRRPCQ